jgi:NADH-quinone oxidoreductase subunit L
LQNPSTSEILFGLALTLPFVSFILSFAIPERYSWVVSITASALILTSTIISISLFLSAENILIDTAWFRIGSFTVNLNFTLDAVARLMLVVVTLVSFLIHVYSIGYMAGDRGIRRYFAMLGFFTFSMLGIVVSGHLILLFMFWELVGFASYMLIGHWMEKPAAAKAAQKAFLFNRIGDAIFLVGIMLMWVHEQNPQNIHWQTIGVLCIFGGVIGKSAQLPLFSWLPDAMEGPTPVSALLHAATMVAAGIFLLIRISPLLTETSLLIITITGGVTALFGALCALNQVDIKKILAYSTISQLGLMVVAIGIGAKDAALLHLFTHAFFKAGLFLAAGSVIHALSHAQLQTQNKFDVQDIRNMGGLRKKLPVTFLTCCIAGASLAGIPLFSGFISKDSILSAAWLLNEPLKWIIIIVISTVSFCTILYTYRMIRFIFLGQESPTTVHESPWVMRIPMLICAVASCWLIVSFSPVDGLGWFTKAFPGAQIFAGATILSSAVVIIALVAAAFIYAKPSLKSLPLLEKGLKLDMVYQKTFGAFIIKLASVAETADKKWIDGFVHFTAYTQVVIAHGIAWFDHYIVDGVVNAGAGLAKSLGSLTRSFQGGKVQLYIFWAVAGLIIFLFFALIQ